MEFEQMVAKPSDVNADDKAAAIAELTGTTESIAPEIKQETVEPIAKEKTEEVKVEPKEQPKEKTLTEADLAKEKRELKHQLLSQVSIKAKELEAEKAKRLEVESQLADVKARYDKGETSAEEYIEKMVDVKLQKESINKSEKQIQELDDYEKAEFLKSNADSQQYFEGLEKIKSDNPNLSWSAANTLYLAYNNPEALVKKTTNLDLGGGVPRAVFNPEPTLDDLRNAAMEETKQWSGI